MAQSVANSRVLGRYQFWLGLGKNTMYVFILNRTRSQLIANPTRETLLAKTNGPNKWYFQRTFTLRGGVGGGDARRFHVVVFKIFSCATTNFGGSQTPIVVSVAC